MKSLDYYKKVKLDPLEKEDMKDFDAKNMMMTVKYWPDEGNEDDREGPQIIKDVTSIKRDPRSGEFIIDTVFDEIRIPYKKFETVIEMS